MISDGTSQRAASLTRRPLRTSVIEPMLEILGHKAKWSLAAADPD
jgi:hypothetical protein